MATPGGSISCSAATTAVSWVSAVARTSVSFAASGDATNGSQIGGASTGETATTGATTSGASNGGGHCETDCTPCDDEDCTPAPVHPTPGYTHTPGGTRTATTTTTTTVSVTVAAVGGSAKAAPSVVALPNTGAGLVSDSEGGANWLLIVGSVVVLAVGGYGLGRKVA